MTEEAYILQLEKKYSDFLRNIIAGEPFEVIRLRGGLEKPKTNQDLHESTALFQKYEKKEGSPGWVVDWQSWTPRRRLPQLWPNSIDITTEEDFLFIINKGKEVAEFRLQLQQLLFWNNGIIDWLKDHPLAVLKYKADWKGICSVIDFFLLEDPRAYYIRNLPVPVHTKFIDQYASLILSVLKSLDQERFPADEKDLETAAGLRKKPHLYAMRWLDDTLAEKYTASLNILALPYTTLQNMDWAIPEVWLVENETNLYLLPERKNALAIFAKGYALHNLKNIPFLKDARVFYWGDLDEDGYLMLEQFRLFYPHAVSVLMDEKTVLFHIKQIKTIRYRYKRSHLKLHPEELDGYLLLLQQQGRIEQEQLQLDFVQQHIIC